MKTIIIALFLVLLITQAHAETLVAWADTVSGGKVLLMSDPCPWNPMSTEMVIVSQTGAVLEVRSWTGTSATWKDSEYVIGFDGAMNGITYPKSAFHVVPVKDRKDVPLFK